MISKEEKLQFTIPKETSWHFERRLKPDDKTVDNYTLIQPGAADIVKVLQAYSHHPVPAYNIASIEIMYSEQLNRQFFGHIKLMNGRKGNPKYNPTWKKTAHGVEKQWREETYRRLPALSASHGDSDVPNIMILPLWHGTSDEVSDYIFSSGYGIFTANDPSLVTDEGFFGKGVYTAHEAEYAFRSYAKKHGNQAVLLLNWVSIFEAYPVIDGDMPKLEGRMGGYDQCDAHFIPVHSDHHPHTDIYYPCAQNQAPQYHEIVVFTYQQCLPRYRVKLIQNAPQVAIDDTASLCYQMALDSLSLRQYASVANGFKDAASAGHPAASVRLHWLYSGVSGVISADSQELQKYQTLQTSSFNALKRKANFRGENDQESQFNLAWCYQHGLGCELNLVKAAQYYWIAAMQGHRDAQYQLGACCATGVGIKLDMQQAITYYEQAAAQGHAHANYVLSQCYEFGLGIQANTAKALMHKQVAQKGKHPHFVSVGLLPMSSPNATLEQNIKRLELQLKEKEQQLKRQDENTIQDKRKINELTQAVSAEKQASCEIVAKKEIELCNKIDVLRSKMDQLEKALVESKDREIRLKMQLQEFQKQPQPVPQLQPQIGQFSSLFGSNPSPKPVLNAQQQEKQNQLVDALLKGDLALVKQMESQGVSLLYPNQEGLYPLVAAVYGCSLETVRYVELKLKDEAGKQWAQVDTNKALVNLNRWMPTELSPKATYGELRNWYVKYNGASWCAEYDSECLKKHGYQNWGGWDAEYKDIKWSTGKELWGEEGARARWHWEAGGVEKRGREGRGGRALLSPSGNIHDDVVKTIREQLNALRNDVETKVKRSSNAVFNF